jgi:hypothetical protein
MEKLSFEPPNLKKPLFWKFRRTNDVCTHKTQLSTSLHFKSLTKENLVGILLHGKNSKLSSFFKIFYTKCRVKFVWEKNSLDGNGLHPKTKKQSSKRRPAF